MLNDREIAIWDRAVNFYRNDKAMAAAMAQTSDLAKARFEEVVLPLRTKQGYNEKIDKEGFIYARFLLVTYAAEWCRGF